MRLLAERGAAGGLEKWAEELRRTQRLLTTAPITAATPDASVTAAQPFVVQPQPVAEPAAAPAPVTAQPTAVLADQPVWQHVSHTGPVSPTDLIFRASQVRAATPEQTMQHAPVADDPQATQPMGGIDRPQSPYPDTGTMQPGLTTQPSAEAWSNIIVEQD